MMESPLFTWIHLADLHRGDAGADNLPLVLGKLKSDIISTSNSDEGLQPDAILVTGNAVGTALPKEYKERAIWLRELGTALGLANDRIFVVPGMKDVDPSWRRDPATLRLVRDLRQPREPKCDLDDIDKVLWDGNHKLERARLAKRMANYIEFSKAVMPVCAGPEDRLFWCHQLWGRDGLRVRLVGLNTALLCVTDGDNLAGAPRLGLSQIRRSLHPSPQELGELGITLAHYPFEGGLLADEEATRKWIRQLAHVQLSAHPDKIPSAFLQKGSGVHSCSLGAGYYENKLSNYRYLFTSVVRRETTLWLRVWTRAWSHQNNDFRSHQDDLRDGEKFFEGELRGIWPGISEPVTIPPLPYKRPARFVIVAYRAVRVRRSGREDTDTHGPTDHVIFERISKKAWCKVSEEMWHNGTPMHMDEGAFLDDPDSFPPAIRRELVDRLQLKNPGHNKMRTQRAIAKYKDKQEVRAVKHIFEATLDCGVVTIKRDGQEMTSAKWRDGELDRTDAHLVDDDKIASDDVYRKLDAKLLKTAWGT